MIEAAAIADCVLLPAPPDGWFDYGYAALADGRLALLRTERDVHGAYRRYQQSFNEGFPTIAPPEIWPDRLRLSIFDGKEESDVAIVPSGWHPKVDRTRDGQWIVASSRAGPGDRNGCIYAPDGTEVAAIALGDGIESLLCATDGSIWVGYFDEGIFGSTSDGEPTVSTGGIVRFSGSGAVLWSYNNDLQGHGFVADCYALTLSGNDVWACCYAEFPIIRVRMHAITSWPNDMTGAKAIAVDNDLVLLAGGYSENADRIAIVKLDGRTSRPIRTIRFECAERDTASLLQGRGAVLHLVNGGIWMRLPVRRAAHAVSNGESPA